MTNIIISSIGNVISAILVIVFLLIMNPNNKQTEDRGYFTYAICKMIPTVAFVIIIGLIALSSIISLLLIDKKKAIEMKNQKRQSFHQKLDNEADNTELVQIHKQIVSFSLFYPFVKEQTIPENKSKKRQELEYNQAIHSVRLYRIVIISFTSSFIENLIFITFIPYAAMNGFEYSLIHFSAIGMLILSSITHPLYEFISGKLSLRKVMLTKSVISLIIGCTFTLSKQSVGGYLFICFLAVITNTMREGAIIKHIEYSFNEVYVYPYIINTNAISFIISAILIYCIPPLFINKDNGYFIVFIIGGVMNIISFFIVIWEGKIEVNTQTVVSTDYNIFS